jgi:hypothetical protein
MKLEIFKKRKDFNKKKSGINPNLYWELVVLVTLIVLISAFIFDYYLFTKINQELVVPVVSDNNQVGTVNTDRIKKALDYFSEREQNSTQILNSPASVVDPSL